MEKSLYRRTVTAADTAAVHDESLPAAASTPFVLALAEGACIQALGGRVGADQVSVGARAEIDHLAPSAVGAELVASAELVEEDDPRYVFDVNITEAGRTVARVRHTRAIVPRSVIAARLNA